MKINLKREFAIINLEHVELYKRFDDEIHLKLNKVKHT